MPYISPDLEDFEIPNFAIHLNAKLRMYHQGFSLTAHHFAEIDFFSYYRRAVSRGIFCRWKIGRAVGTIGKLLLMTRIKCPGYNNQSHQPRATPKVRTSITKRGLCPITGFRQNLSPRADFLYCA